MADKEVDGVDAAGNREPCTSGLKYSVIFEPVFLELLDQDGSVIVDVVNLSYLSIDLDPPQSVTSIDSLASDQPAIIDSDDIGQLHSDSGQLSLQAAWEEKENTSQSYLLHSGEKPSNPHNSTIQGEVGNNLKRLGDTENNNFCASCGQTLSNRGSCSLSEDQNISEEDGGETAVAYEHDRQVGPELVQKGVCKTKRKDSPCDSEDVEATDLRESQVEDSYQIANKLEDNESGLNSCDELDKGLSHSAQMSVFCKLCGGKGSSSKGRQSRHAQECLTKPHVTDRETSSMSRSRSSSSSERRFSNLSERGKYPGTAQPMYEHHERNASSPSRNLHDFSLSRTPSGMVKMIQPLPSNVIQCKQFHHLMKLKTEFEFDFDESKHAAIKVTTSNREETQKVLNKILAKFHQKQLKPDPPIGFYLQSPEGKKWLARVQQDSDLSVQVIWPILLTARNSRRHQLLVCGGNITAADRNTQVVVLPFCEESPASSDHCCRYKDWTPECKQILEAELLLSDPAVYTDMMKEKAERRSFTLMLKSPRPSASRYITLMHVPVGSSDKFRDLVSRAVTEVIEAAVASHSSQQDLWIALPLVLGAKDKDKEWKVILPAAAEALNKIQSERKVTLTLYTGPEASEELISSMERYLSTPGEGWTTLGTRIELTVGNILDPEILEETDVMVNSTDPRWELTTGKVSKTLLEKAGKHLATECRKEYPDGLNDDCLVAVTGSHGLKPVKNIFHIALPQTRWNEKDGESLLEELRTRVLSCLMLASAYRYGIITFPVLGSGNLQYPPDRVAETMFSAAQDFFDGMPHSSVHKVLIVCYGKDRTFQEFKNKEKAFGPQPKRCATEGGASKTATTVVPTVHLCGQKNTVEEAMKKIQEKNPPLKYFHAVSESGSCVDGEADDFIHVEVPDAAEDAGMVEHERKNRRRQKRRSKASASPEPSQRGEAGSKDPNLWSFSMPASVYEKLLPKLNDNREIFQMIRQSETETVVPPRKRLWLELEHFGKVLEFIQKAILQSDCDTAQEPPYSSQEPPYSSQEPPYSSQKPPLVAQGRTEQNWSKVLEQHEVLALTSLIGQEFIDMFTVNGLPDDQREIEYKGPSPPQMILDKIDSLRYEEIQVLKEEAVKLGEPFDTRCEGVDAYIFPDHDKGKITIFSLEYSALSKAKHIVNIKLGKVKVTSRGNRRFESEHHEPARSQASQQPAVFRHASANGASGSRTVPDDFVTKSGLKVSVYKTDITKLPLDAIVNAANERLRHSGGVAFAIARAAGFSLEDECADYISRHGVLKVTEVMVTTGGNLPCRKVLHAVGPRWNDYKDKAACQRDLSETILNCLKRAHEHRCNSLAVSSVSSAIFGVPQDLCAECYLRAVQEFDGQFGGTTSLAHVHFVDVNDTMISTVQKTFAQKWNTRLRSPLTLPACEHDISVCGKPAVQAAESQKSIPAPRVHSVPGSVSEREVKHAYIEGVDIFFHQQPITSMQTESVVLWQQGEKLFEDPDSQQIIAKGGTRFYSETVPKLKMQLRETSTVSSWEGSQLFICHTVPLEGLSSDDLRIALREARTEKVASITIPVFSQVQGSSKYAQGFADSLQKAVSDYRKLPDGHVKQIHVISSDWHCINAVGEAFSHIMIAVTDKSAKQMNASGNRRVTRSSSRQQQQTSVCAICNSYCRDPWGLTKCKHVFCRDCIGQQFTTKGVRLCPECQTSYEYARSQPKSGAMKMKLDKGLHLEGFTETDTLAIEYSFPKEKQKSGDPEPGQIIEAFKASAYLPNNSEGRKVLMLLQNAFDRGVLFCVGYNDASQKYVVAWNDIPHKTDCRPDPDSAFGYPDPGYLLRVQGMLLEYGISEKDLTPKQQEFVYDPKRFCSRKVSDFFKGESKETHVIEV